jgi:5-methylcytosine-specific restriction endonuclease McrA
MFKKGHTAWNKGIKHTEIEKERISYFTKIAMRNPLTREKISNSQRGKVSRFKGKKHTEESKELNRKKHLGKIISDEVKIKMRVAHLRRWDIIGRKKEKRYIHLCNLSEYRKWRKAVFERNNYTCQGCGKRGCYLQAHHIKSWAKFPKLRYLIINGVSLCKVCHKKIHFGNRKDKYIIKMTVRGADAVIAMLAKKRLDFDKIIQAAVRTTALQVERQAKLNAPVKSGNLRRSIISTEGKRGNTYYAEVGPDISVAPYAVWVEMGHAQQPGRYVPALGKTLVASWVNGKWYMATTAIQMRAKILQNLNDAFRLATINN